MSSVSLITIAGSDGVYQVSMCHSSRNAYLTNITQALKHPEHSAVDGSPVQIQASSNVMQWNEETGWLMWGNTAGREISLCWLPIERRGHRFSVHNNTVAIGTGTGIVSILDLTGTIELLQKLGVIDQDDSSH
jgi:hypothetical protein